MKFEFLGSVRQCTGRIDGHETDVIAYRLSGLTVYIKRISRYNTWLFAGLSPDSVTTPVDDCFSLDEVCEKLGVKSIEGYQ